jgi:hypothetical protein
MSKVPHVVYVLGGRTLDVELERKLLRMGKLPLSQLRNFSFSIVSLKRDLSNSPGGVAMYLAEVSSIEAGRALIDSADILIEFSSEAEIEPLISSTLSRVLAQGKHILVPAEHAWQGLSSSPQCHTFTPSSLEQVLLEVVRGVTAESLKDSAQISSPASLTEAQTQRPLRLLQILTSYEEAILQLYKAHPALGQMPFEGQVDALVQDGFNAAHILAPALRAHGFETGVIIANCKPAQEKWLAEQKVRVPLSRDWVREITKAQIAFYQPDIVYTNDPLTFEASFIESLTFRPKLMVGWRAAPIPGGISWKGYDLMVSNISGCREIMLALGAASVAPHNPGFPRWLADQLASRPHETDLVFAGSLTKGHQRRVEYVDFLARAVIDQANHGRRFSSEFYVGGDPQFIPPAVRSLNRGDCFGRRYFEALRRGRIVLDIRGSAISLHDPVSGKHYDMAGTESGSMRLFEGTGCGCLLLTDHHAGLSRYFEVGTEIVSFTNERDMVEKIAYFSAHPDEAARIAQRGHERCMREYSVEKHAEHFGHLLRASIEGREYPGLVRAGRQ